MQMARQQKQHLANIKGADPTISKSSFYRAEPAQSGKLWKS